MRIAYVDGYKIRQTLDTDFNVIHRHEDNPTRYSPKFYIPRGQIWIDNKFKSETKSLVKAEKFWFEAKGMTYQAARKKLCRDFTQKGTPPNFIGKTQKKNGLTVHFVDGSTVRRFLDPRFVCGGHDKVYDYVPRNQVWIDALMNRRDLPHVLLHEITERRLMAKGMSYEAAHEFATAEERLSRRKAGGRYPGDEGYKVEQDASAWLKKFILAYA